MDNLSLQEQRIKEETLKILLCLNQASRKKHKGVLHSWKSALDEWVDKTTDKQVTTSISSSRLECHCQSEIQEHKLSFILIRQDFSVLVETKVHYKQPLNEQSLLSSVVVHTDPFLSGVDSAITECCHSNKELAHVIAILERAIDEEVLPYI